MHNTVFKGSAVALVTPYDTDNHINIQKLNQLIHLQIKAGTSAIVLCGTTGESPALTFNEKNVIYKEGVNCVNKRVPVIAGTGANNTDLAVELSKSAQKAGVDALLCVTPYYNKTSQNGLIKHYFAIADSVDIPLIIYNVPSRTGMDIDINTYEQLCEHPNICAVKEASGNIEKILSIKSACGDKLDIYSGNDEILVPSLAAGCIGVISVAANIIPHAISALCKAYLDNENNTALLQQIYWQRLIKSLFLEVNPIPVKEAMNYLGYNVGLCRAPLCEMDSDKLKTLMSTVNEYSIEKIIGK